MQFVYDFCISLNDMYVITDWLYMLPFNYADFWFGLYAGSPHKFIAGLMSDCW